MEKPKLDWVIEMDTTMKGKTYKSYFMGFGNFLGAIRSTAKKEEGHKYATKGIAQAIIDHGGLKKSRPVNLTEPSGAATEEK